MNRVEEIRVQLLEALPNLDIFGEGAGWELAVTPNGPKSEHTESYSIPEHEVYWVVTRMKDAQLKSQLAIVTTAYSRLYRDEITLAWYGGTKERQRQTAQLVADMPTNLLYLLERIQELEGQDWFTRAITAEAGVEVLSGRVRDLEWYLEQARQERDAALEQVRVLGSSIKAFLDFRGLICGPEYHALVLGLTQAFNKLEGEL